MQYLTVTDISGNAIRISLGAIESWEPAVHGTGSIIHYAGQTLGVKETPDMIDAQIAKLRISSLQRT